MQSLGYTFSHQYLKTQARGSTPEAPEKYISLNSRSCATLVAGVLVYHVIASDNGHSIKGHQHCVLFEDLTCNECRQSKEFLACECDMPI